MGVTTTRTIKKELEQAECVFQKKQRKVDINEYQKLIMLADRESLQK